MQALTPDIPALIWQATKYEAALIWQHKEVVCTAITVGWRAWKLLRSLPDALSARINFHADARMTEHEAKDDARFEALESKQEEQFAQMTRQISTINPQRRHATGD